MQLPQELVLVRHGESEGNLANRMARAGDMSKFTPGFCYRPASDWHLTRNGEDQAKKAGAWLRSQGVTDFDVRFSSDYYRASETIFLMGPEYDNGHVWYTHLLRERSNGLLELTTADSRLEQYQKAFVERDCEPYFWTPPGGESIDNVVERARLFFEHLPLLTEKFDRVLVVCHGEMMWAFRVLLEGISPEQYETLHHSDHPGDFMYNCHALHYKRKLDEPHFTKLRSVCTYSPDRWDSKWHLINKPVQSSKEQELV